MSESLPLIAFALTMALSAVPVEARADGGQIIDTATNTKFDEITHVEGFGTGVCGSKSFSTCLTDDSKARSKACQISPAS